jgi:5,10-methylenetetrahydrofolate reductase
MTAMMTTKSKFGQALTSGRPVITAECLPPRSGGAEAVKKLSTLLPASLDAIVVADNPDEIHGSALACAALLAREGRDAVVSMTTRDRNRIALESDALGASALGVGGILCLTGNHQSLGVCPQAASANDIDSIQLALGVASLDLPDMLVGAVAEPHMTPIELNVLRIRKKIAAGADFLLTEPVFDLAAFGKWMDAIRAAGLDSKVAIIASVLPLESVEKAKALQKGQTYGPIDESAIERLSKAADPAKEGLAMAAEMAAQLKTIPGVRGIHILCGGNEAVAGELIAAARLA